MVHRSLGLNVCVGISNTARQKTWERTSLALTTIQRENESLAYHLMVDVNTLTQEIWIGFGQDVDALLNKH